MYFSNRISERSGKFSTKDCAYMREPMECIKDPSIEDVTLMWGTQTGKTTVLQTIVAYSIDASPRPMMFAFPTDQIAKDFVTDRWNPLLEDSPEIAKHVTDKWTDLTLLKQRYDTCTLFFTGAGSASKLSSKPVSLIIADETDKFGDAQDKEADKLSLLSERNKSFLDRKFIKASTPTVADGNIARSYAASDMRQYLIPCPHCGAFIPLEMANVKWAPRNDDEDEWDLDEVRSTAYYECAHCRGKITDRDKHKAIQKGRWEPFNKKAPRNVRGYRLNSLYSPILTFGEVAVKFLQSKNDVSLLQNFTNSWLAEVWEDSTYDAEPDKLKVCQRDYDRGDVKGDVRVVTVDVQRRDLRFNVRGYDANSSYLLDWGTAVDFEHVEKIQKDYDAKYVGIDINYREREQEVYEAIYKNNAKGWIAIVGLPDQNIKGLGAHVRLTNFAPFTGTSKQSRFAVGKIRLLNIRTSVYKSEVAGRRIGSKNDWFVYRGIERGYELELFAEVQAVKLVKSRRLQYWKQIRADNHQFDLEVYQLAICDYFKLNSRKPQLETAPTEERAEEIRSGVIPLPKKKYVPIDKR